MNSRWVQMWVSHLNFLARLHCNLTVSQKLPGQDQKAMINASLDSSLQLVYCCSHLLSFIFFSWIYILYLNPFFASPCLFSVTVILNYMAIQSLIIWQYTLISLWKWAAGVYVNHMPTCHYQDVIICQNPWSYVRMLSLVMFMLIIQWSQSNWSGCQMEVNC